MLTKVTDFTGIIDLGLNLNTGVPSVTRNADVAKMEAFIDWYEKEYFRLAFGRETAQRLCEYACDRDGSDEEMENLILEMEKFTPAPAACYVYFKYLEIGQFHASPIGVDTASDSTLQNPRWLQMRAWNCMVEAHERMMEDGYYVCYSMTEKLNGYGI